MSDISDQILDGILEIVAKDKYQYTEFKWLCKALKMVNDAEKKENENLEYAHMNFCEAQAKEKNIKELRISYDGNGEQLDRVVFNGETYELRSKRACKVELTCEPNERPVLRIEYVGREKG